MKHKYKELDALRWLAAFAVGMGHAFLCFLVDGSVPKVPHVLGTMVFNGAYAVDLFFVLSGFVLINATKPLGIRTFAGFLARRALRIYPAAWMSLVLAVLALAIAHTLRGYHSPWVSPWIDSLLGMPEIGLVSILGILVLTNYGVNTTLWTIAIELAASIAYPLFVPLIKSGRVAVAVVLTAIAVFVSAYVAGGMAITHVLHYAFMFMTGACLNFLSPIQRLRGRNYAVFAAVGLMFCARLYGQRHGFASDILSVGSAAIAIGTIAFWCPPWLERFLARPALVTFGRASYSYYLINPAITFVLVKASQILCLGGPSNSIEYIGYSLSLGIVAAIMTIPMAVLSAEYLERSSIRVGRMIESRILSGAWDSP